MKNKAGYSSKNPYLYKTEKKNMMKENDSFAEPRFPVRSYGKGELAMYYLPGIAQQTAVNRLNEWIRTAPGLEQRLLATGMNPYCRRYTPAQVQLMINVFGEPS